MSDISALKTRKIIEHHITRFAHLPLKEAATALFNALGYESERTVPVWSPSEFAQQFDATTNHLQHAKALLNEWLHVELLFQLTDTEIARMRFATPDRTVQSGLLESYIFFAIELNGNEYSRGKLAGITRQINRIFQMPVLVLYKYHDHISLSIINRRRNKRDDNKDVLGKVTTIHGINIAKPHPGHIDIIRTFSIPALAVGRKEIANFDQLHAAWESVFNIELLNQRFYRELANWFFWTRTRVDFPNDAQVADDIHRSTSVIRLLTRLLFCWFLREKYVGAQRLIPDQLFDEQALTDILNDVSDDGHDYYQAILQNLFFATLNTPMHSDQRRFATDDGFVQNKAEYGAKTLYRYASAFKDPAHALTYFASIPHLNGGLFTCLDIEDASNERKVVYLDGFSRNPRKAAKVPNYLFFGRSRTVDLSVEYGDPKRTDEPVRGIFHILNDYKFTLSENTPLDQEVALDPELLGQVFENLLAAYNPETNESARKQTGSFYTPRTIVDYMVDQSLIAYFAEKLGTDAPDMLERISHLLAYNDEPSLLNAKETQTVLKAIEECKIFDPACGSGAFPMGVLNKLVHVLQKLDPENKQWKETQIARLDSPSMRELLRTKYDHNDDDYGRKLGLIEHCIFGSDIQPIAIQIAKLRFFISLLCDQRTTPDADNYGIEPLPNLETKFVVADTLVKLPGNDQLSFGDDVLEELRHQLSTIRHQYFLAQTRDEKRRMQERDHTIRQQMVAHMQAHVFAGTASQTNATIKMITQWDPYNPQSVAAFFDSQWMFGKLPNGGFDIIIGNPPYVQIQKYPEQQKQIWNAQGYETYTPSADIYCLFYDRGLQLLRRGGYLSYITSNRWMRAEYGQKLRALLSRHHTMLAFDFGMAQNFNAAAALTCIIQVRNAPAAVPTSAAYASDSSAAIANPSEYMHAHAIRAQLTSEPWVILAPERQRIKDLVMAQGTMLSQWDIKINRGILTGLNDAFYVDQTQYEAFVRQEPRAAEYLVRVLRGRAVDRYAPAWDGTWMINSHNGVRSSGIPPVNLAQQAPILFNHLQQFQANLERRGDKGDHWTNLRNCAYLQDFTKPKIIYPNMTKFMPFYLDKDEGYFTNQKCYIISGAVTTLPYLTAVFNSTLFRCCFKDNFPELLGNTYELSKVFFERIPIKKPTVAEAHLCNQLVTLVQRAKQHATDSTYRAAALFIEEVIDLCVAEFYFAQQLHEQELHIIEYVSAVLQGYDPDAPQTDHDSWVIQLYKHANEPRHPVRNRLIRRAIDSPDVLGVMLQYGRV